MVTKNAEKIYLKVEKGRRPRIRVQEESHKALVSFFLKKRLMFIKLNV